MLTVGSLFAGIGGFDVGFQRAGMKVIWQVENDRFCNSVLETHWPEVKRYGDITTTKAAGLARADIICGGFPCQGVSVAGKREGLADERTGLYWQLVRVVSELHPEWVVLENVPGLLSCNQGKDFALVLGGLAGMVPEIPGRGWRTQGILVGLPGRWSVAWRVLDSQWFGLAQRRRRVFFVGHPDPRCAGAVLFEPESGERDSAPMRKAGQEVTRQLAACLNSGGNTGGFRTEPGEHLVAYSLSAHGGSHGRYDREENYVACASADSDRVREVAGLPRRLDGPRYKALGNAVTVQPAEWIGRRIVEVTQ